MLNDRIEILAVGFPLFEALLGVAFELFVLIFNIGLSLFVSEEFLPKFIFSFSLLLLHLSF